MENNSDQLKMIKYENTKKSLRIRIYIVLIMIFCYLCFFVYRSFNIKSINTKLNHISNNIEYYIEQNEFEKAELELNKMEILNKLPNTDKNIWKANRDHYIEIIKNKEKP